MTDSYLNSAVRGFTSTCWQVWINFPIRFSSSLFLLIRLLRLESNMCWKKSNKATRLPKDHFIMSIENTFRRVKHKISYIHNDVWRGRWLELVCLKNRFSRLMLISKVMWQTPRPSSTKPRERRGGEWRGDQASDTD